MPLVRLQKILADAGLGSRRACERFIEDGHVSVNGRTVRALGTKADPEIDDIRFDSVRVCAEQKVYFLVNKPRGYICSNAASSNKRVIDLLAGRVPQRVYPVGRLDVDSEGLMILTNDGDLALRLSHPRYGVEKGYWVKVEGRVEEDGLAKLSRGVYLSEGRTGGIAARIGEQKGDFTWLDVSLHEGRNREIRRVLARLGYRVRRLKRVRIAGIEDPRLKPGDCRRLTRTEVERLRRAGEDAPSPHAGGRERGHRRKT